MSESITKYLSASVDVPSSDSFDELANKLTQLMPGFVFKEEVTSRYEEVPAYEAKQQTMEFVLFGVPPDEIGEHSEYGLHFKCRTDLPLEDLLAQDAGGFVRRFVDENASVNEYGFLDVSDELAALLVELGIPGCRPIRPVMN